MARKKTFSTLPLLEYANMRIQQKKELNKTCTAELYQVTVNHFLRFTGNTEFRIKNLTRTLVSDFTAYLQSKGLATNTINSYLSSLRAMAIVNFCVVKCWIPYSFPYFYTHKGL